MAKKKSAIIELICPTRAAQTNIFYFIARLVILIIIYNLTIKLIKLPVAEDFISHNIFLINWLDRVNLLFHEAGHVIFGFFGKLIMFLGGAFGQLLMPLILSFSFFFSQQDAFSSAIMLWWFGENFTDIAPYINDARSLNLVLLGGKTGKEVNEHDWENILDTLNLLHLDYIIADYCLLIGKVVMIIAATWASVSLFVQLKKIDT